MQVKLKILKGTNEGREVKVTGPKCFIGRADECQIRPQSDAVSRRHTLITISDKEVMVSDLKSRNGTYVNDQRITENEILISGDVLRIGPMEFEVIIEQPLVKPKRPPVQDVKDLVARTAGGGINSGSTMDMGDVSKWIEDADEVARAHRMADPETRQFRMDETDLGPQAAQAKEDLTKSGAAAASPADASKTDAKGGKKEPGKLPPMQAAASKNSRDAAAETLKKFFGKR